MQIMFSENVRDDVTRAISTQNQDLFLAAIYAHAASLPEHQYDTTLTALMNGLVKPSSTVDGLEIPASIRWDLLESKDEPLAYLAVVIRNYHNRQIRTVSVETLEGFDPIDDTRDHIADDHDYDDFAPSHELIFDVLFELRNEGFGKMEMVHAAADRLGLPFAIVRKVYDQIQNKLCS